MLQSQKTLEFLQKLKDKGHWNDDYDYTKVIYINAKTSVILFNKLIKISTPIFSSSVTYLIPIVAICWGVLDGEKITLYQFVSGLIILLGVYLVNKAK